MTNEPTSNNIVRFTGMTKLDLPADTILSEAIGHLDDVVIIGTTKDGNQYFSASSTESKNLLWHLETAKFMLMESIFYGDEQ